MYPLIIVIHIIACLMLIVAILLQSGRGGGISELFGSGSQTIFGTRASTFLTRATTAAAITFLLTCIGLSVLSSSRMRSLMTGVKEPESSAPVAPEVTETEEIKSAKDESEQIQEEEPKTGETELKLPQGQE